MLLTKNGFYLFYIRRATFLVQNQYYITEYFSFFPCVAMALNKIIKSILIEGHVISSEPLQKWFITIGEKKKKKKLASERRKIGNLDYITIMLET